MEQNYASIPKLQRCNRWSLGITTTYILASAISCASQHCYTSSSISFFLLFPFFFFRWHSVFRFTITTTCSIASAISCALQHFYTSSSISFSLFLSFVSLDGILFFLFTICLLCNSFDRCADQKFAQHVWPFRVSLSGYMWCGFWDVLEKGLCYSTC